MFVYVRDDVSILPGSPLKASHTLLRRSASYQFNSPHTPSSTHSTPVLVVVVVAIVSLAVLISLVALCAGSNAYDPQQTSGGVTLQKYVDHCVLCLVSLLKSPLSLSLFSPSLPLPMAILTDTCVVVWLCVPCSMFVVTWFWVCVECAYAHWRISRLRSPSEGPSSEPTVQFNSPKPVNVEVNAVLSYSIVYYYSRTNNSKFPEYNSVSL